MSSAYRSVIVFYTLITLACCRPQQTEIDNAGDWGIQRCVITDEIGDESYGCDTQEIQRKDFQKAMEESCIPEVYGVYVQDKRGLVTVEFSVETPSCERNHNRSRGVVITLEMSETEEVNYKFFTMKTKHRLQTKSEITAYSLAVSLPNRNGVFIARVAAIHTQKGANSFMPPILVGDFDEHHTYHEIINPPEINYVCQCTDITVVTNDTIFLNLCDSQHLVSSTVTLQGTDTISKPVNTSACEKTYPNLVDGNYTVLAYYECKNNESRVCSKVITIRTRKEGDIRAEKAYSALDVNRILVIAGFSTGGLMAFVFVFTVGKLIQHYHQAEKKQKERKRITEPKDIMLVYTSDSDLKNISAFADLLWKSTGLSVHFADDVASQEQRFSNKFDWLDKCLKRSSNVVFIASKEMCTLLENSGKVSEGHIEDWLEGIFCYVMNHLRDKRSNGLKRSRYFIVSLTDDKQAGRYDYAKEIAQFSIFQSKGTQIFYVSQKKPIKIPMKLVQKLHGKFRRQKKENGFDIEDRETLLPREQSNEAIAAVV
ncbi:uncharacterized protein LOC117331809 [Pecten maximus]|uniref:uncharacterized protein LOC117331809 n=1 Tax=Pecten maximus TaxID=6579 RepID=UPI0014582041|nr:uncharacterized protein LOC117331809 [Pecten maximus]